MYLIDVLEYLLNFHIRKKLNNNKNDLNSKY